MSATRSRSSCFRPLEVTQFDTGFGEPDGPELTLKVVGIARVARDWWATASGR